MVRAPLCCRTHQVVNMTTDRGRCFLRIRVTTTRVSLACRSVGVGLSGSVRRRCARGCESCESYGKYGKLRQVPVRNKMSTLRKLISFDGVLVMRLSSPERESLRRIAPVWCPTRENHRAARKPSTLCEGKLTSLVLMVFLRNIGQFLGSFVQRRFKRKCHKKASLQEY